MAKRDKGALMGTKYRFVGREVDGQGNEVLTWESVAPVPGDSRHVALSIRPELFWPERLTMTEEACDWLGRMPVVKGTVHRTGACVHCGRASQHIDSCFEVYVHPGFCTQMEDRAYWEAVAS